MEDKIQLNLKMEIHTKWYKKINSDGEKPQKRQTSLTAARNAIKKYYETTSREL